MPATLESAAARSSRRGRPRGGRLAHDSSRSPAGREEDEVERERQVVERAARPRRASCARRAARAGAVAAAERDERRGVTDVRAPRAAEQAEQQRHADRRRRARAAARARRSRCAGAWTGVSVSPRVASDCSATRRGARTPSRRSRPCLSDELRVEREDRIAATTRHHTTPSRDGMSATHARRERVVHRALVERGSCRRGEHDAGAGHERVDDLRLQDSGEDQELTHEVGRARHRERRERHDQEDRREHGRAEGEPAHLPQVVRCRRPARRAAR